MASCMGGLRTTGDLVAWMQMTRKMRLAEAKAYVADKLGLEIADLTNEEVVQDVRFDLGIGTLMAVPGIPKGIMAKKNIAELLDIEINSVNLFRSEFKKKYNLE
ncbi:MAG: hypothetical protein K9L30_17500 [Desulfobacterales bacterium]|nr:hypothetical protein [Desulfobacterales bacterium]